MKFKSLFLMALVAMAFTACSKDDDLQGGGEDQGIEEKGEAYASLSFAMPGGAMTKAGEDPTPNPGQDGDGTQEGTPAENGVTNVTIIGFHAEEGETLGTQSFKKELTRADLTPTGEDANVIYRTAKPFTVTAGTHNVYVIVNNSFTIDNDINQKDFEALKTGAPITLNSQFLMTSADPVNAIVVKATNTATNPVAIKVNVERAVAKITYKATKENNKYAATVSTDQKVQLVDYKLINFSNNAFLFRRVGDTALETTPQLGGKEKGSNYVLDVNISGKTVPNATLKDGIVYPGFLTSNYINLPKLYNSNNNEVTAEKNTAQWNKSISNTVGTEANLGYCLENTFDQKSSLKGYGTGIIFKAIYDPDGEGTVYGSEQTFYRYLGKLYATYDLLKVVDKNIFPESDPGNEVLRAKGVDVFEGGVCYYPYFIRHANNNKANESGIMEFAMVRNNVYKLTVTSIKELGYPTEHIRPEEPIEDAEPKLDVTVTVLPWVVRNNDIEL